ncbi:hypothetical protein EAO71_31890 [Streptomyces sp. ms191]|nr:hypothetical protein EAO71_31890 [Streptomyces sp. ms191]
MSAVLLACSAAFFFALCAASFLAFSIAAFLALNPGHPDVRQADASNLPFDDGTFSTVHAVNPFGFNPVSSETARVMQRGGILIVSAAKANKFRKISEEAMREAGFELVSSGTGVHPDHLFGVMRRADGGEIDPTKIAYEHRVYRRL